MNKENIVYYLRKKGIFEPVQAVLPELPHHYVRLMNLYCGICGGDYSCFIGRRTDYPVSLGHEFISQIIEVGSDVEGFCPNDYVVSDLNYRCGTCGYCTRQQSHLCVMNNSQFFTNRAFSRYLDIDASYLVKVNLRGSLEKYTLAEPLSCVLHASHMCQFSPDRNILIFGCGSIGTLFSFYLSAVKGIKNVYVHDIIPERKLNLQNHFGVAPMEEGLHYDIIVDASNSLSGLIKALQIAPRGGTVCIMSHLYGTDTSLVYEMLCQKELHPTFPLRNGSKSNLEMAISYINEYWQEKYNTMLYQNIIENINDVFRAKETIPFNKQLLKLNGII